MSGVFGFVSGEGGERCSRVVVEMGERMRHRPYQVVEVGSPRAGVGLGRIGIGIINRDRQPVCSGEGEVWVCLSGEFFHQEARREELVKRGALEGDAGDAEMALQVYLSGGAEGLTELEGEFVVVVWDGRSGELVLVNDRFGLYPHYIAHAGGGFVFAPEIKGVLCAPGVSKRLNLTAIAEYVRFQQMLGDKTWFEDVMLLPPASLVRYWPEDDRLRLTRYWDWDDIGEQPAISFGEAVEECIRLFQRGVDARIRGPYRVGVYLSGGLDSRTILGFIGKGVPVTTITYGVAGCRDVVYAAEIARRAGSDHHWFPFVDGKWVKEYAPLHLALTEGMHSWVHSHGISTLDEARKLIDVNLTGWDGGTVLGGSIDFYRDDIYRHAPSEVDLAQRFYDAFCQRFTWPGLTEPEALALLSTPSGRTLRTAAFDSMRAELARTAHYPDDRRADYFYIEQVLRRSLQQHVVLGRSAFEVRCPYFDYEFVAFMYSLPEDIRTRPMLRREVISRRMPRLAAVPHEKDDLVPHTNSIIYHWHAILQRGKRRLNCHLASVFPQRPRLYADYEEYLRTDLRDWAEGILFDQRTRDRGLFDPTAVRALWERHLKGNEIWTIGKIAPLMTIELVLRYLHDDVLWTVKEACGWRSERRAAPKTTGVGVREVGGPLS
mgnify:CR=1 FL=1